MIDNPAFWFAAIIAVLITGISKGGFGGLALFAVPIMSLTILPTQAAGIMLPILIVMDAVSVWIYRKFWDKSILIALLPGALLGITIGGLLASTVNNNVILICVGLISILFPLYAVFKPKTHQDVFYHNKPIGAIMGIAAGFTSFLAHSGGPFFQAYAIPQKLEPRIHAGSSVIFFAVLNFVKLLPYGMLGQFDKTNLTTSLVLMPLAPVGVLIGSRLIRKIDSQMFYNIIYVFIFIAGLKLLWDGIRFSIL